MQLKMTRALKIAIVNMAKNLLQWKQTQHVP